MLSIQMHGAPKARPAGASVRFATHTVGVDIADSFARRLFGLLLGPPRALWLTRTRAVHTFGMRYAIDVCFVGGDNRVCKVAAKLPPWRAAICLNAVAVLEWPAGRHFLPRLGETIEIVWPAR